MQKLQALREGMAHLQENEAGGRSLQEVVEKRGVLAGTGKGQNDFSPSAYQQGDQTSPS